MDQGFVSVLASSEGGPITVNVAAVSADGTSVWLEAATGRGVQVDVPSFETQRQLWVIVATAGQEATYDISIHGVP